MDHRQLEPTLHSIPLYFKPLAPFACLSLSFRFSYFWANSILGIIILHCHLSHLSRLSCLPLCIGVHPPSLFFLSPSLSSHPVHLDSWTVKGVTGVSRRSPSLFQLVDLCLGDYSAHSSLLASRFDKSAWQLELGLMCCDHATLLASSQLPLSQPATVLRLDCPCMCVCVWAFTLCVEVCTAKLPFRIHCINYLFTLENVKEEGRSMRWGKLKGTEKVEIEKKAGKKEQRWSEKREDRKVKESKQACVGKDAYRTLNHCFSQCERCIITQPYHSNDTIWAQGRRQLQLKNGSHRSRAIRASAVQDIPLRRNSCSK